MRGRRCPHLLLLLSLLLTSCRTPPPLEQIEVPCIALDKAVHETAAANTVTLVDDIPEQWWLLFNDDQLNSFMDLALAYNPSLQAAESNILIAANQAAFTRADLFPNISFGADVSRQKLSETGLIPFGSQLPAPGGQAGIPVYFTQYETELILNYDFDLWGKNRNRLRAALSETQSRLADEAFTKLEVAYAVASAYYQLQIDYERLKVAQEILDAKTRYTELIAKKIAGHLENALALQTAKINQADAENNLLQLQESARIREHLLHSYLSGSFQEEINSIEIVEAPLKTIPFPEELPLHLIARRPDIISQIWLIESAGRQIEVARAGFYPDFNIMALAGLQTIHLSKLFEGRSGFYNIDPAVTLPVFDAGRLAANLRGSAAFYDLVISDYNQMVLQAAKEVLDALTRVDSSKRKLTVRTQEFKTQETLNGLVKKRLANHLDSGLQALDSKTQKLQAKDRELIVLGETIQAQLDLIKAIGGGYLACYE